MAELNPKKVRYAIIMILDEANPDFVEYLTTLIRLFSQRGDPFETVIIANGTEALLRGKLGELKALGVPIKCFCFHRMTAESVCLKVGLKESSGEMVFLTGSYQQIAEESLRALLEAMESETDAAIPWRQERVDPWLNRLQSRVFNGVVRVITKSGLQDLSCNTRIFRRRVLEEIEVYGGMFRFLPILASMKGYRNLEVKCRHFQERGKKGFYGFSDYVTRIVEIFTLFFNLRFTRKPLRFFNILGAIFLVFGLSAFVYVFVQKTIWGVPIGGRPVLLLGILFMVIGAQAASVGLLAEIVAFTHGRHKRDNLVEKII